MSDEGFFSRWSRRKAQVERGERPEPEPAQDAAPELAPAQAAAPIEAKPAELPASAPEAEAPPPPPTLEDVSQLTRESDYSRFMARDVDDGVKQAALKKLFSDPHFNQMDGLDVYIDDYSQSVPIPQNVLRKMVQAQFLGLFRDEEVEKNEEAKTESAGGEAPGVTPSYAQNDIGPTNEAGPDVPHDENPDLQLQPDDAAGRHGPGPGPRN